MGCGSTGAVLVKVADWSVLATEESWLVGFGCAATRLELFWGGSPPAAIATARPEGLHTRFERFRGILGLLKNSKETTRYYPKQYSCSERLTENQSWERPKQAARKACQTNSRHSSFLLMPK